MLTWLRSLFGRDSPAPPAPAPPEPCDLLDCGQEGDCPWCGAPWWEHETCCSFDPLGEDPDLCDCCGHPEGHHCHVPWEQDEALHAAWERWTPGTREFPEVR